MMIARRRLWGISLFRLLDASGLDGLATAMGARRAQVRMRLGLAASFVILFGPLTGWAVAIGWFSVYAVLQALEHLLFERGRPLTLARGRLALAVLALNGFSFGALAIVAPFTDGPWGVTGGNLLLAGAILNTVMTSMASRAAFVAALTPFALYMTSMPVLAISVGASARHGFLQGAAGALIVVSAAMIWRAASRAYRAEVEARARSDDAVAAKSAFLAIVSHELRTPISAILAGAAEVERNPDSAARTGRLIGDAGVMMRTLLNDLLDLAKLDAGRLAIECIDFDLRRLLCDQMRFWKAHARDKGLRLRFEGATRTPGFVVGDPTRIRQILNNLISNALKFTQTGSVSVRIDCVTESSGVHALRVAVTDTGPGMSADQISRLFVPFEQLETSVARNHGGTGLGLAISRDLARLMEGDIGVESTPGGGSTFVLSLRLRPGAAGAVEARTAQPSSTSASCAAILVVDDHEINRRALSLMLDPTGATVTCAASAAEALDLLADRPFDVVLMDCHMPGMDGRAATRRLRAAPGPNRSTPVIAVTGATDDKDIRECRAAGMTDYVAKPIDATALYNALARALEEGPALLAAVP